VCYSQSLPLFCSATDSIALRCIVACVGLDGGIDYSSASTHSIPVDDAKHLPQLRRHLCIAQQDLASYLGRVFVWLG
jgi:hypothetical protein